MDFQSIAIFLVLGILAFLGFCFYFFIKQLEFVLRAINLYEQMVSRQDMTVKLLKEIRDGLAGKTQHSKYDEIVEDANLTSLKESPFKIEAAQTVTNNLDFSKSALSEEELQELKGHAGEDAVTIPYATNKEWICVCGTHNPLDRSKTNQNCSNCRRNRDFILSEYRKKEMK